ncbi:uncharacterized protein [Centruroides vittatus]|uniref:uncharacterized protein n=1 Tax=Centruroides vittatus TaxID=120091 RepID=UPI00350FA356
MVTEKNALINNAALFVSCFVIFFFVAYLYLTLVISYPALVSKQKFEVKEYEELLNEMYAIRKDDINLELKLKNFMMHHEELWIFVQQFNTKLNYLFAIIYFGILWSTSFVYYAFLFLEIFETIRYFLFVLLIICTLLCVISGCLLCSLAFTMQNAFQDIRQFADCSLQLEEKLKIIDFMKRFGKVPLRLSMAGFYHIDKKIILKMASTLHSVFSGLLKLKRVTRIKTNCTEVLKSNYTETGH